MEYIEGTPQGALSVDQALKYAAQICDALVGSCRSLVAETSGFAVIQALSDFRSS